MTGHGKWKREEVKQQNSDMEQPATPCRGGIFQRLDKSIKLVWAL